MTRKTLRIAVGLSGGVDSSVTALLLKHCVHSPLDVQALLRFGHRDAPPPSLRQLQRAVDMRLPCHQLLPAAPPFPSTVAESEVLQPRIEYRPFFMQNWSGEVQSSSWCAAARADYEDAERVSRALHLLPMDRALPVLNFSAEYIDQCFNTMVEAYAAGSTLNVDILCNSRIKFGVLWETLACTAPGGGSGGVDYIATGHYARTLRYPGDVNGGTPVRQAALLLRPSTAGHDLNDQTVFLSRVAPAALASALFPLGHLLTSKEDVRALARHFFRPLGIGDIAAKKTSTGLCFVGSPAALSCSSGKDSVPSCTSRFASFLNEYMAPPSSPPEGSPAALDSTAPSVQTILRDITTGETLPLRYFDGEGDKTASATAAMSGRLPRLGNALREDYPHRYPSFCFTIGQRLRCRRVLPNKKVTWQHYYVCSKIPHFPTTPPPPGHVVPQLLNELHLVPRWNHPLLYASAITMTDVVLHVSLSVLPQVSCHLLNSSQRILRCWCCTRHQEPLTPASVCWRAADEKDMKDEAGSGLRIARASVALDKPIRAITPGQAVVMYIPLADLRLHNVTRSGTTPDAPAGTPPPLQQPHDTDSASPPPNELCLVGCGWIEKGDDK